jgi:hypothetical protein
LKQGGHPVRLCKQLYGKGNDYSKICEANLEISKDANLIFPGQKIRIPLGRDLRTSYFYAHIVRPRRVEEMGKFRNRIPSWCKTQPLRLAFLALLFPHKLDLG